jgi:carbon starvation protein CstA
MNTFPIMLGVLCVLALGYRYYSTFIAAKALVLDDSGDRFGLEATGGAPGAS